MVHIDTLGLHTKGGRGMGGRREREREREREKNWNVAARNLGVLVYTDTLFFYTQREGGEGEVSEN